jgi:hypothetical protein
MPHLVLGILIMLAGALVMAAGLYVRSVTASSLAGGRTLGNLAGSALLLLIGLALAVVGIIVSFEPGTTAPR